MIKIKEKIVPFFLSKINVDFFSRLIKKNPLFRPIYKIAAQKLIDYNFPRHVFIETTSICNLKCKMCARNNNPVVLGTMSFDIFRTIIDEAKKYGPRTFSLHLFGEPLIDPGLTEKVKYIKQANSKNSIILTTNGILLTPEISKELIKNRLDKIVFSVHSPDNETYKTITGFDQLEKVEENIKNLLEVKEKMRSSQPIIALRLVKVKENIEQVEKFCNKWSREKLNIEIRDEHNFGGEIKGNLKITTQKRYPCYHLWFSPGVNWDGKVSICCTDVKRQAIIGDIKNSSLAEIWQSDLLKNYRRLHLLGQYEKIPLCADCDVWDSYPDIFFNRQKSI